MTAVLPRGMTPAAMPSSDGPLAASERLDRSREQMRRFLRGDEPDASPHEAATQADWMRGLRKHPLAARVIDAARDWWTHHPMFAPAQVGVLAAREALAPLARRHPLALVGAALFAGAGLVLIRPWRWLLRPALFAGVAVQIVSRVIARLPIETKLAGPAALLGARTDARPPQPD